MASRLRILLVIEATGGGVGRHVLDLARGLCSRGHEVHVAWSPLRAEPSFAKAVTGTPDLRAHVVRMQRGLAPSDARALSLLRRLLERHDFDVVHGHSSKAGALARIAAARSGLPALYTPHAFVTCDTQLGRFSRFVYATAERALAALGAAIICVSEEERTHALSLGIPGDRVVVVPNGIAPMAPGHREEVRRSLGVDDDTVCVGFVGRLSRQKGVSRLLRAFARGSPVGTHSRLVVVGDGPERAALERLADQIGAGERVIFTGQADGPALMAGFDVFALPSRYEGFAYVLLEAAARGLPIVSTAVGGASTVVRAGENGWLIPQASGPEVVAELARAIGALAREPALRAAMGRCSSEISSLLTVDVMVDRTLAVYHSLVATQ